MNKEWFSDYKEQISLNNMQEARNVILDNIDKTLIACAEEIVVREVAYVCDVEGGWEAVLFAILNLINL